MIFSRDAGRLMKSNASIPVRYVTATIPILYTILTVCRRNYPAMGCPFGFCNAQGSSAAAGFTFRQCNARGCSPAAGMPFEPCAPPRPRGRGLAAPGSRAFHDLLPPTTSRQSGASLQPFPYLYIFSGAGRRSGGLPVSTIDTPTHTAYVRDDRHALAGGTAGDGQQDARPQARYHHPDLRQNYQRQDRAGYGGLGGQDRG